MTALLLKHVGSFVKAFCCFDGEASSVIDIRHKNNFNIILRIKVA